MRVLVLLLLMIVPALAEQPQISPAQIQQAIGQKLMDEVGENVKLRAQLAQVQEELDKLKKSAPADGPH